MQVWIGYVMHCIIHWPRVFKVVNTTNNSQNKNKSVKETYEHAA